MRKLRSKLVVGAAIGGAAIGGAAIANAASSSSSTSSTSTTTPAPAQSRPRFPAPGTAAHEDAEKPVTGTAAATARAAAVKAVGGGIAGPVTTDFTGSGYETTVTKSDGSEVHLNTSFKVMQGPGGHGEAPGRPGGPSAPGGQAAPWAPGGYGG
jgi:hypothetical protein